MADSGTAIDFFAGNNLKVGIVTGQTKNKVQVTDQNGRQHSVSVRHIAVWHQEKASLGYAVQTSQELLAKVTEISSQVDTELLWESLSPEQGSFSGEQLAQIYFGESTCCTVSAVLRAILQDPLRFKQRAGEVHRRSKAQIDVQLAAERKRREKEEFRITIRQWFRQLLDSGLNGEEVDEELRERVLRRLEDFLLQRQKDDEVVLWLEDLDSELSPRSVAYDILSSVGRLPQSADPLLIMAGIDPRFSRDSLNGVSRIREYSAIRDRTDGSEDLTVAIDDENTREIDDAVTIGEEGENLLVSVHIADISHFVHREDILDQEARRRISTLYLPQTTVHMFPERLSCDLASLTEGSLRPSLTFQISFSPSGPMTGWKAVTGEVKVGRQLSYEEADRMIESSDGGNLPQRLRRLSQITQRLAEERCQNGALVIRKPELKIEVRGDEVRLKVLDPGSPSRNMIGELMILVNRLAAQRAREADIPLIYRSQAAPATRLEIPEIYDPVLFYNVLAQLEKSRLSIEADPHSGLGLESYTQITSPIRRYCDLVLQRQLKALLASEPVPYSKEDLVEVIGLVQSLGADIRAVERKANRYYVLTYLLQNCQNQKLEATVLKRLARGYLVETLDLFIRGLLHSEQELQPGYQLSVRIGQLNPSRNLLTFQPA